MMTHLVNKLGISFFSKIHTKLSLCKCCHFVTCFPLLIPSKDLVGPCGFDFYFVASQPRGTEMGYQIKKIDGMENFYITQNSLF